MLACLFNIAGVHSQEQIATRTAVSWYSRVIDTAARVLMLFLYCSASCCSTRWHFLPCAAHTSCHDRCFGIRLTENTAACKENTEQRTQILVPLPSLCNSQYPAMRLPKACIWWLFVLTALTLHWCMEPHQLPTGWPTGLLQPPEPFCPRCFCHISH